MHLFQFKVNGEWWTWINYDKFHELMRQYYLTDGASTFTAEVSRILSVHVTFVCYMPSSSRFGPHRCGVQNPTHVVGAVTPVTRWSLRVQLNLGSEP